MVKHNGIGATSTSVAIFSILLISNMAIFVASQDRARLYSQADVEDSFADSFLVLEGAGAASVLVKTQSILSSFTFDCSNASSVISREINLISDVQRSGNLIVSAHARVVPGGGAADNLTMLSPFSGSTPHDLDIAIDLVAVGASPSGVGFTRAESHLVHLNLQLSKAVSYCSGAVSTIRKILTTLTPDNCSSAVIASLIRNASQDLASEASSDGFSLGVRYTITSSPACSVVFVVALEQKGIYGMGATFNVHFEERGSVQLS